MGKFSKRIRRHKYFDRGILLTSFLVFGTAFVLLWLSSLPLPDFASFEQRKVVESTKIYDRTGEVLLFDVHKDIKRTVVPLEDMSRNIKNATIAIEDSDFYKHSGVKISAIIRAFIVNITSGDTLQGGSTITQQVIKNTLLSNEKKITRKIKEAVLAIKLERVMDKDSILEIYLNEAPYGGNIYGIEEAGLAFFGKKSSDFSLAESAYLAALPKAPTFFSPYGEHIDRLEARKNTILGRMFDIGFISESELLEAKNESVVFAPVSEQGIKAPHFVIYVREFLEDRYGSTVDSLGLRVVTTLDWEIQSKLEEIVLRNALSNTEKFNATNIGAIVLDPVTGHILAMVGSRSYFDEEIDGNFNVTLSHRQPGSSIKPFIYATAFKKGYTPDTVVFDLETQFATYCDPLGEPGPNFTVDQCYSPVNYDSVFRGPVTLREALAQSINVPSVKTLYLAGLVDSLKIVQDFGIKSLTDVNRYGLTLVLGGGEVSLLELSNGYGVFATEGIHTPPIRVVQVEDRDGNNIYASRTQEKRVIDENIARTISSILSDNEARAPAFGYNSPLYIPGVDVAVKTGTTNNYRDAWTVGYTPEFVVGVWAGNNDNSPMEKKVAGFVVTPTWNEIVKMVLEKYPGSKFNQPEDNDASQLKPVLQGFWQGSNAYYIDTISGKLATNYTPEETKELKVLNQVHSILHWVNKNNPNGPMPTVPDNDSQYTLWEHGVLKWAEGEGYMAQTDIDIPSEFDDIHTPETMPVISSFLPLNLSTHNINNKIQVDIDIEATHNPIQVDIFFNDIYVGSASRSPYRISFIPSEFGVGVGKNTIAARVYDGVKNSVEKSIFINLVSI